MSTNIQIVAGLFDGNTIVSLANPNFQDALGYHRYAIPTIGIFDLETVPNMSPSTPIWMQVGNVRQPPNPAARFTFEVYNRTTNVRQPLFTLAADPLSVQWNVLLPQNVWLAIFADDGVGGPSGGVLDISFWAFASKEWPYLQCCHKFGPYEGSTPS